MTSPRSVHTVIAALAIVLAGTWAYAPALRGVFVFDDLSGIARNPHIRSLSPLSDSLTAPPDTTLAGRPVASLTFALNYALTPTEVRDAFTVGPATPQATFERIQRNARGYHLGNLAIHLLAALTLFGVVRRTLRIWMGAGGGRGPANHLRDRRRPPPREPRLDVATGIAAAIALLWVVHPLTTSAVTYIVQRVESLMALCYLLTLYCAIRAWEARSEPRFWRWAAGALTACALGMGTKEVMVTAPLAVVGWGWVFGAARAPGRRWWGLLTALCGTWIVLVAVVTTSSREASVGWTIAGWTPWIYLLTQAQVLLHYVRLVFWPAPLLLDYGWTPVRAVADSALPLLLLTSALAATVVGLVRRHALAYPAALFFLILAPTSSLLPIGSEIAAEHRMYLPLAAVVTVVAGATVKGVGSLKTLDPSRPPAASWLLAVVVIALGLTARDRSRDYWSEERLWQHDIAHQPAHARPRISYGTALFASGRYADAEVQFRAAVDLEPREVLAQLNLGAVLCARGRLDEGITHLERARAIDADHPDVLATLGDAYTARGDDARAVPILTQALAARPNDVIRLNRLGWLLATSRDDAVRNPGQALDLAARAVTLTGKTDVMSLNTLAAAHAAAGQSADAVNTMTVAIAAAQAQGLADIVPELERRRAAYAAAR